MACKQFNIIIVIARRGWSRLSRALLSWEVSYMQYRISHGVGVSDTTAVLFAKKRKEKKETSAHLLVYYTNCIVLQSQIKRWPSSKSFVAQLDHLHIGRLVESSVVDHQSAWQMTERRRWGERDHVCQCVCLQCSVPKQLFCTFFFHGYWAPLALYILNKNNE